MSIDPIPPPPDHRAAVEAAQLRPARGAGGRPSTRTCPPVPRAQLTPDALRARFAQPPRLGARGARRARASPTASRAQASVLVPIVHARAADGAADRAHHAPVDAFGPGRLSRRQARRHRHRRRRTRRCARRRRRSAWSARFVEVIGAAAHLHDGHALHHHAGDRAGAARTTRSTLNALRSGRCLRGAAGVPDEPGPPPPPRDGVRRRAARVVLHALHGRQHGALHLGRDGGACCAISTASWPPRSGSQARRRYHRRMSFFAILFALLIEQVRPLARAQPDPRRRCAAGRAGSAAISMPASRSMAGSPGALAVVVPALPALAIHWLLLLFVGWPAAVVWSVRCSTSTLGFRQFSHHFTEIRDALDAGDEAARARAARAVAAGRCQRAAAQRDRAPRHRVFGAGRAPPRVRRAGLVLGAGGVRARARPARCSTA